MNRRKASAASGGTVRLAYLCNVYPAVSHSFVRREIEAIEEAGHEVHRFSVRPAAKDLKDEADIREVAKTEVILGRGFWTTAFLGLAHLLLQPMQGTSALAAALRLSAPGLKSKVRHMVYWLEAACLARRLNDLRIEHLHAHFGTNPAAVATIAHAWGGPPFSFTVHGQDEFDAPVALGLGKKIAAAQFVIAISSYGRSQLMRWSGPAAWDKIRVIRCGLDAAFLEAKSKPVPAQSSELLCVARLSGQKGLPLLIAACERLRQKAVRFTVTIIGDGALRTELEHEIRKRKLENVVSLVGVRTATEIRERLIGARAFVLPSFAEGLPVVLMEALALSRPVIATSIAGIPELVDNACGWIIPAGSEDALVQAMSEALEASVKDLSAKGRVGRERVRRLHDARKNAEQIIGAIAAGRP